MKLFLITGVLLSPLVVVVSAFTSTLLVGQKYKRNGAITKTKTTTTTLQNIPMFKDDYFTKQDSDGKERDKSEYKYLISNLSTLLEETSDKLDLIKTIARQLMELELDDPQVTQLNPMNDELSKALAEAKAADDVYGTESDESKGAWHDAMDISAAGATGNNIDVDTLHHPDQPTSYRYKVSAQKLHHMYSAIVDPQSLNEVLNSIGKIEHLTRLVEMEENRIAGLYNNDMNMSP